MRESLVVCALQLFFVLLDAEEKFEFYFREISRMVAIADLPSRQRTLFRLAWCLEKSQILFSRKFANGGHREFTMKTPHFFSSWLVLRKNSDFIFAKFREWWPSWICHHDTALFFVLVLRKELNFIFAKIREWWPS